MRVILASGSPRRKELLSSITNDLEVIVSNCDESFKDGLNIEEQSKQIAFAKAKAVFDETSGDRLVIGSDTMVLKGEKVYGKPKNKEDAFNMLTELQNNMHKVITSISVLIQKGEKYIEYIDYDISKVYISKMDSDEIYKWLATGKAMDKAGAYAVQEDFRKYVEKIEGNYDTIMGLPTHMVYNILKQYL